MVGVVSKPDTEQKLRILSTDAQYDLACACGTKSEPGRQRGTNGSWVYPITLPNGGKSVLFKTLMSNVCSNDCKYCPLREQQDIRRCSLGVDETVKVFMDYHRRREVFGLFLSSGQVGSADNTMERLIGTARQLRKKIGFKGYIHLKIIPGASSSAIEEAVSLANAVSINIETPGEKNLAKLSLKKDYIRDIIEPIKLISKLTGKGSRYSRVKQTTQFIVGAAGESDAQIVKYMWGLYDRLKLQRIYFSAYQQHLGDESITYNQPSQDNISNVFIREHRLYQVDFLMRKYGFTQNDIIYEDKGRLSLEIDPKEAWAQQHPEFFPLDINCAGRNQLLRVPGLGPVTVSRIIQRRIQARISDMSEIGRVGIRLKKALEYIKF